MSKGKRKKEPKKVHGNKYANHSKAEKEFQRLIKPPEPPKPVDPYYSASHHERYRDHTQPRSSSSTFGLSLGSTLGRIRQRGSGLDSMEHSTSSDESYTRWHVGGGDGSDYTCGNYRFDNFSFLRTQIPSVANQVRRLEPGRHSIILEGTATEIEIIDENLVRLPYD